VQAYCDHPDLTSRIIAKKSTRSANSVEHIKVLSSELPRRILSDRLRTMSCPEITRLDPSPNVISLSPSRHSLNYGVILRLSPKLKNAPIKEITLGFLRNPGNDG